MPSDNNDSRAKNLSPAEKRAASFSRQFAIAKELPFSLVSAVVVGGMIGFFLDRWLHTAPYLMLGFGFLGFFGGLRDVLRRTGKE